MAPEGKQIGSVVTLNGTAWAVTDSGDRLLQNGDPIYEGESVVTGKNANMEIQFIDGTLLGQGGEARVDLDEYIFDGDSGGLDFQMVTGVMRMVSGKIAETNPEAFNIATPLATIGIRGTEIIAKIDVNGQIVGVTDMSPGHYVIVATADGEVRINAPGLFSGVDENGFIIQTQELSQEFIDAVQAAVPLTSLGDAPRDPDDPDPDVPNPSAEPGAQAGPAGDGEPGGDPEPGGDDPQLDTAPPPPPTAPPPPVTTPILAPVTTPDPTPDPDPEPEPEPDDDIEPEDDPVVPSVGESWTDVIQNSASHTGTAFDDSLYGLDGNDTIYGVGGDDHIDGGAGLDSLLGGDGNDTLLGGLSADFIQGDAGSDSIDGGAGDDILQGNDGTDIISGGAGYDSITGGIGADTMTGGDENDTFHYVAPTDGGDTILDFDADADRIGLHTSGGFSSLDFDSGHLSSSNFYYLNAEDYDGTGIQFDGPTSGIIYASDSGSSTGKLYYDPDVTNVGDEVLLATMTEYVEGVEGDNNLNEYDLLEVSDVVRD